MPDKRYETFPDISWTSTSHHVALVEVQLIVAEVLYGTVIGPLEPLALISAVGGGEIEITLIASMHVLVRPALSCAVNVQVCGSFGIVKVPLPLAGDKVPEPIEPSQEYGKKPSASFLESQLYTINFPGKLLLDEKFSEQVGRTYTVTLSEAEPPGPVHESEYVLEEVKLPLDLELNPKPDVPVQPVGETEQDVALVEDQLIVAEVLYRTVIGPSELLALISAVGDGGAASAC